MLPPAVLRPLHPQLILRHFLAIEVEGIVCCEGVVGGGVVEVGRVDAEVEGAARGVVGAVGGGIGEEHHLGGECPFADDAHTVFGDEDAGGAQFRVVVGEEGEGALLLEGALKGLSDFFSPVDSGCRKCGSNAHGHECRLREDALLAVMDVNPWAVGG